jgi:Predicted phosphatase/phosphohexomutase
MTINNTLQNVFKTLFFDLDGVVIDSEKLHLRAMGLTLEKHGILYPQSLLHDFVGRSDESFFRYVYENIDNNIKIEELIHEKNGQFDADTLKQAGANFVTGSYPALNKKISDI